MKWKLIYFLHNFEEDSDKIGVTKKMKLNLNGDMSFRDVKTLIENENIEYFDWLDKFDTNRKRILIYRHSYSSEYSDLVFIHLFIVHKFQRKTIIENMV